MYCPNCGTQLSNKARFCPQCGNKREKKFLILPLLTLISVLIFSGTLYYVLQQQNNETKAQSAVASTKVEKAPPEMEPQPVKTAVSTNNLPKETKKQLTEIIAEVQRGVYTIYTDSGLGSAFLMNDRGDIITNAHVVEGYYTVSVKDKDGAVYEGQVIGYSNNVDIALIRVPALQGSAPLPLETEKKALLGEEVIALGSPMGLENTATFGYISGVDRSFFIGKRSYDHIYQMSAPIAPGNSGGPLVSKSSGKVIAINSAKMLDQDSVGFSIPVMDVHELLQSWSDTPLTYEEIDQLFYTEDGGYYYEDLWSDEEWYFEGGESSEEETYEYYDIPSEWYNEPESDYYEEYEEDPSYYEEYDNSELYDDAIPYTEDEIYDDGTLYEEENSYDDSIPYDESDVYDESYYEQEMNDELNSSEGW